MDQYALSGTVFVTFDFVGFHRWQDAPEEVKYLRFMHRHLFKVRVDISVEHSNRELEYHMAKRRILGHFWMRRGARVVDGTQEVVFGEMSCEAIALTLLEDIQDLYPDRPYYRVEVSEDGENGSTVEAKA